MTRSALLRLGFLPVSADVPVLVRVTDAESPKLVDSPGRQRSKFTQTCCVVGLSNLVAEDMVDISNVINPYESSHLSKFRRKNDG